MSTIHHHASHGARHQAGSAEAWRTLPKEGRGDAIFGALAVLIAALAMVVKLTGIFA